MLGWRLPRRRPLTPGGDPRRALVEQAGERRVHQRDLDVAPLTRAGPFDERGLDAVGRQQPADQVHDRRPGLQRAPVRLARDRHQPAHGLQQEVVAGQRGGLVGGRAERGHRAGDEPGVVLAQRVAVEAPGADQPGPEGLDQHVGAQGELTRQRAIVLVVEVERERALVAVQAQVVGALALVPRRAPGARVVAAVRALDLDHVGAEVAQQHRGERAGEHAREVGDEDSVQWRHGRAH